MRTVKTAYSVPLTIPSANPFSVRFPARIAGATYTFLFQWVNEAWMLSVTMSDGTVRLASTVPGVVSWSAYPDFGLLITSPITQLGQNDLATISIYWIVWE